MVAAVLLAAGSGTRFEGEVHKLLAPLGESTVLEHALDAVRGSGLEVFVVTGAVDLDGFLPAGVTEVPNPDWHLGQATSVRAGIAAAAEAGHDAVVVGLADQPFVTSDAWTAVAEADGIIAVATYHGERGNPVKLHESIWDQLPVRGDEVGRALMRGRPDLVLPIPCAGAASDIDTLEDLHRWT